MKGIKKQDLTAKNCIMCGRPFTWRKKWETIRKSCRCFPLG
ncbi:DUF2256 domain-containing protein [Dyadobacter soli]|nr:DUF2256 domain-containing protein [Dyadobacter soli]